MKDFFVEQIMSGFLIAAFPVAFVAGLVSFLSPCILPLVPGYLSFAAGFSVNRGKVFLGSILFVLGFSVVFISFGAIFGGLGNQLVANEDLISRVLGVITIFLGFIFLGKFPFAPTFRPKIKTTGGLVGAPVRNSFRCGLDSLHWSIISSGSNFSFPGIQCSARSTFVIWLLPWIRTAIYGFRFVPRSYREIA